MSSNDDADGVRVWVGRVPPGLCVGEEPVRELFRPIGEVLSVQIHHDFADMSAEGFMFLRFESMDEAVAAVDAVQRGTLDTENRFHGAMHARLALRRGGAPVLERDKDTADLLLGRRLGNTLSQRSAGDDGDDDLLLLQSLSQSAFGSQQNSHIAPGQGTKGKKAKGAANKTKTKTKTPKSTAADDTSAKRRRKEREANSFLSPALDG
ncbi:hypothetical protein PybrP1_012965 [[Pythium] brassicae (nom. inval.)]|nr:hypothetical protein PybrP1_012965 [[Pythium] brassicae (nom. inval.)]